MMKCPRCGQELRRSQRDPSFGLCDNCRKKFKLIPEEKSADTDEGFGNFEDRDRESRAGAKQNARRSASPLPTSTHRLHTTTARLLIRKPVRQPVRKPAALLPLRKSALHSRGLPDNRLRGNRHRDSKLLPPWLWRPWKSRKRRRKRAAAFGLS